MGARVTTLPIGRAANGQSVAILARYANRHALVTGATGTGKSNSLATMAESFSLAGVPSLIIDAKGDLAGLARTGHGVNLDPFGECGEVARLNVWRMGADLLTRALELSEAQSGALDIAFEVARLFGFKLDSLGDLRAVLQHVAANAESISTGIGLVTPSSVAAVQRALLRLDRDAGDAFGSPWLDVASLEVVADGRGRMTVLAASRLARTPGLYAATCAHILQELYERAPEVGDLDRPRLAVILDESHLIFADCPPRLAHRLESIVRLIRSKGVALIFASQSPADIPTAIAGQLQNRVQHGLRGVTLADQRAIRAAAETLPRSPGLDAARVIERLQIGEALVSVVGVGGVPGPCERVMMRRCSVDLSPMPVIVRPVEVEPAPVAVETVTRPRVAAKVIMGRLIGLGVALAFVALLVANAV